MWVLWGRDETKEHHPAMASNPHTCTVSTRGSSAGCCTSQAGCRTSKDCKGTWTWYSSCFISNSKGQGFGLKWRGLQKDRLRVWLSRAGWGWPFWSDPAGHCFSALLVTASNGFYTSLGVSWHTHWHTCLETLEAVLCSHQLWHTQPVTGVTQPRPVLTSLFSSNTSNSSRWLVGFTCGKSKCHCKIRRWTVTICVLAQPAIKPRELGQDYQVWCKSLFEMEHPPEPHCSWEEPGSWQESFCLLCSVTASPWQRSQSRTDHQGSLTDWFMRSKSFAAFPSELHIQLCF